jgi:4-amino-4-deoxy-L-arabinose transferase-like glycosyltransferase
MTQLADRSRQRATDYGILAVICFVAFFMQLGAIGLFDFNEGLYVSAARDMHLRGDWVTARVNGIPFWDKPYLALWLDALSFTIFGVNEFAARLPVAVAATALVFLTYRFGARYFGRFAGLLAGCILALNPLFFGTARQMTMDIHQSLWFAVAMVAFFFGTRAETAAGKRWFYAAWASCGLGFLAKSVPGLFPIFLALVYVVIEQRFRAGPALKRVWETKVLLGLPLMAAIILPWFWLSYRAHGPQFWDSFFWHHHVQLLTGKDFGHAAPFWFYVPATLLCFFPWSLFLPSALAWPSSQTEDQAAARRLLLVWTVGLFVIFSIMTSKVVSYLLPMYSPAAILVGDWLARTAREGRGRALKVISGLLAVVSVALMVAARILVDQIRRSAKADAFNRSVPPAVVDFAFLALTVLAIGGAVALALMIAGRRKEGIGALIGSLAVLTGLAVWRVVPAMDAAIIRPLKDVALEAGKRVEAGQPLAVCVADPWRPSIYFYLPARAFLQKPRPDFEGKIVPDSSDIGLITGFLAEHETAYVLADARRVNDLLAANPGMSVEVRYDRYVLLRADRASARPDRLGPPRGQRE